jgi:hypothetical protein
VGMAFGLRPARVLCKRIANKMQIFSVTILLRALKIPIFDIRNLLVSRSFGVRPFLFEFFTKRSAQHFV